MSLTTKEVRQLVKIVPPPIGTLNVTGEHIRVDDSALPWLNRTCGGRSEYKKPDPSCPAWQGAMFEHVSRGWILALRCDDSQALEPTERCSMSVEGWVRKDTSAGARRAVAWCAGATPQEALCRLVLDIAKRNGMLSED